MTTKVFNQSVNAEIQRLIQQGNAVQVCSAGEWPETDHGGNWTPDRIEANHAFSEYLDQQGDSLLPTSFSDWISQNNDSIIE